MTEEPTTFTPASAAAMLAAAWRSGRLLTELPADIRPRTMSEGYDVQDALVAELGLPVVGWKLGVGSAAQKASSGVGRSIAGPVLGPYLHGPGATVVLPNAAPVTIELEIAYVLGRDIRPDEPDFPVSEAVAAVRVAFELVLSRFVDRRAVGWPSFAADNGAFEALVLGEIIDPAAVPELARSLVVRVDGREEARSLTGQDATDPEAALADLVAIARERGMVLPEGSIVSTGTVSKPFTVAQPEAEISASYLDSFLTFHTRVAPYEGRQPGGTGR